MNRSTIAVIGVILIYLLAALVEPCDGHSCDVEVTYEQ